jgi:hypothetical protein
MRDKTWTRQGRLSSRLIECLARISVRNEIDLGKFFSSFLDAFDHGEAMCGELSIKCRVKTCENAVFLITNNDKVVAQLSVPLYVLAKNPLKEFTYRPLFMRKPIQEAKSNKYQIKDLRVGMKHVNVKARVLEVSEPRLVVTRSGFYAKVVNILVADETGTIQLPLWNRQIGEISAGALIQIEGANVITFRGVRQLRVGKNGKVSAIRR